MANPTLDAHIEIDAAIAGGKPRIAGRRISVQDIVIWHERLGKSADEIASEYDLALSSIYAALAYYFDHRNEIDRAIQEGRAFARELKKSNNSPLREKLEDLDG